MSLSITVTNLTNLAVPFDGYTLPPPVGSKLVIVTGTLGDLPELVERVGEGKVGLGIPISQGGGGGDGDVTSIATGVSADELMVFADPSGKIIVNRLGKLNVLGELFDLTKLVIDNVTIDGTTINLDTLGTLTINTVGGSLDVDNLINCVSLISTATIAGRAIKTTGGNLILNRSDVLLPERLTTIFGPDNPIDPAIFWRTPRTQPQDREYLCCDDPTGSGDGYLAWTTLPLNQYVVAPSDDIQETIDRAETDGHDQTNPCEVIILPGTYVGDISLVSGIHVRGFAGQSFATLIEGDVTYSAGGPDEQLSLQELNISGHFIFSGSNKQQLWMNQVAIQNLSDGDPAIQITNSGVGSQIIAEDLRSIVSSAVATAYCLDVTSGVALELRGSNMLFRRGSASPDLIAIHGAAGTVQMNNGLIDGQVSMTSAGSFISGLSTIRTATIPALITSSSGTTLLGDSAISTTAAPAITGAGVFIHGQVSWLTTGAGFDAALNGGGGPIAYLTDQEVIYNAAVPGDWSGSPPLTIRAALDRIAAALGPIA